MFQENLLLLTEGCKEDTYTLVRDKLFLLRRGNPDMFGQDQLQYIGTFFRIKVIKGQNRKREKLLFAFSMHFIQHLYP